MSPEPVNANTEKASTEVMGGNSDKKASSKAEKIETSLNFTTEKVRPFATLLFATIAAKMMEEDGAGSGSVVKQLLRHQPTGSLTSRSELTGERKTTEQEKADLVKDLLKSGIDPALFDSLLSNEINRTLKVRFGAFFLVITFVFTAASYIIVILNSVFQWKISDVAITSLIIQAPIQLIGLLYIVARNLFPGSGNPLGKKGEA